MKKYGIFCTAVLLSFLLGIQDGYIALWKDGIKEPVKVYPYQAASLPPADQKLLEQGIRIDEDSALAQLLEDYLS